MIKIVQGKWMGVLGMLLALATGCTKDPGLADIGTRIRFINASPDAGPLGFQLNGNNAANRNLAFGDTTHYSTISGGAYRVALARATTTPVSSVVDFVPAKAYSLFAYDSASRLKLTVINDEAARPMTPLRAGVRFLNFNSSNTALSIVAVNGADTTIWFANRGITTQAGAKSVWGYSEVKSNQYELWVAVGNLGVYVLPQQIIAPQKHYTLYCQGSPGKANFSLKVLAGP